MNKSQSVTQQASHAPAGGWWRYRTIVVAVALFLVFDLGVLIVNFVLSARIESDAAAVNLAGRQRMLSQRTVKALLLTRSALADAQDPTVPLDELKTTAQLFDTTLHAFDRGGTVTGADGKPVGLNAVGGDAERDAVAQGLALWQPYKRLVDAALAPGAPDATALAAAVDYARTNNLAVLKLMNDLTVALEKGASARAERLRAIQVAGITLALINFVIILFHFIRKLGEGDRRIDAARRETQEILDTVKEGLFLLGADGRIGGQTSASLSTILHTEVKPGHDFFAVLEGMVPEAMLHTARSYVELLFAGRVRENLVGDLNPLNRLEVLVGRSPGSHESRYLDIQFNRVMTGDRISHLLVTVQDITEKVRLEEAIEAAKRRAGAEVGLLMNALSIHPVELNNFLAHTESELLNLNELLKRKHAGAGQYKQTLQAVFRAIHAVKGEAAALGLESLELLAHDFEQALTVLRERDALSGDDMLALPVHLNRLLEHLELVRGIQERMAAVPGGVTAVSPGDSLAGELQKLADRIAVVQQKHVRVEADLHGFEYLPASARHLLKDVAIQLVRNAVYHGIEHPTDRSSAAKPEQGTVSVRLRTGGPGEFEFVVRDDGCGLQPQRIREALVDSGRYRPEDLAALDERSLAMKIFEPGVSTAAGGQNLDAGRGVGLDVVKARLSELRARLKVASAPGRYTEFRIQLAT